MAIAYQDKTVIPDLNSIFVSWFIHEYVDWDIELECYVSKNIKEQRAKKEEEVMFMYDESGVMHNPSIQELEFLFIVEQDQVVKQKIYKLIKFWRNKLSI